MIRFDRISLENFGPYKGLQHFEFPSEPGVSIIYGENMRGKTMFLNAIRYALYGKFLGRGSRAVSIHKVGNWEAALAGEYGFKVILSFDVNGVCYILTRACVPKHGVDKPTSELDYTEDHFLEKNGVTLGPEERDVELSRILPEQVSRFFLFDGELLQEYENLLIEESETGEKITKAIERILGVPVLINSRVDLNNILKIAQREESKAAQRDQATQEIGNLLEDLGEKQNYHEEELKRLGGEKKVLLNSKLELDDDRRRHQKIKALLDESDRLATEVESFKSQIEGKRDKIRELSNNLWKSLLTIKIATKRDENQSEIDKIQSKSIQIQTKLNIVELRKQAISDGICPTCTHKLSGKEIGQLESINSEAPIVRPKDDNQGYLSYLLSINSSLNRIKSVDVTTAIREMHGDIDELTIKIATKEDRINQINEETKDVAQAEIRDIYNEYDRVVKEIALIEDGIKAENAKKMEISDSINKLQTELDKYEDKDLTKARNKRETIEKIIKLINESISIYRDSLKSKVQKDATDIFLKLTTEEEYAGLHINVNYGLSILHKDGQEISIRSAGAEHIVALSLMGALQRNAPLQGPIIMDSSLHRLDDGHTKNVVHSLPHLADQVTLLVFESELRPELARHELKGKLKSEFRMVRLSARHTTLEKMLEG